MRDDAPEYDDETLSRATNEFLLAFFLPAIGCFVVGWIVVRTVLDDALRSLGLVQLRPAPGAGAIASGWGRFLLLIGVGAVLTLGYLVVYVRYVRGPLKARGVV